MEFDAFAFVTPHTLLHGTDNRFTKLMTWGLRRVEDSYQHLLKGRLHEPCLKRNYRG
jgi:hypothetical protein